MNSSSFLPGSRDSYKSSRYNDDSDWRRRDRNSSRERYDYSSHRYLSDDRGRESRYSSHRDYYSRGKDGRDNYHNSDSRRTSYRDTERRRSRDSDDSYGSEKSYKSSKGQEYFYYFLMKRWLLSSFICVIVIDSILSFTDVSKSHVDGRARSPRRARSNSFEKDKREAQKSSKVSSKTEELVEQKDKMKSSENKPDNETLGSGLASKPANESVPLVMSSSQPEKLSSSAVDTEKSLEKQSNSQDNGTNYLPVVEDISPVSSPTQPTSYPPPSAPVEVVSDPVQIESSVDTNVQVMTPEDNDDAMSLSSISSNEETLEVTKPVPVVPPPIPFPPPPVLPPPFMPPYNPSIPPPSYPAISIVPHRMPIPSLSMATLPPLHPLVPPTFHPTYPPQFVSTLNNVPPAPVYQSFPSGRLPSPHEQRPVRKNWKIRISEEVLKRVTEELAIILKKDVNKKLVENSAFKALDGWWDNAQKTEVSVCYVPGLS